MRVFISGKITGVDNYIEKFNEAEKMLTEMGSEVINPATALQHLPNNMPHEFYMDVALSMLKNCDCIYMLDNWRDSRGAKEEHEYAANHNIDILYEDDRDNMAIVQDEIDILKSMCNEYHSMDPRYEALKFAILSLEILLGDVSIS